MNKLIQTLLSLVLVITPNIAYAKTYDEVNNEIKENRSSFEEIQSSITKKESEIEQLQQEIDKLSNEYEEIQSEKETLQEENNKYLVYLYKNGDLSLLNVILSSESLNEFLNGYSYINYISSKVSDNIQEQNIAQNRLQENIDKIDEAQTEISNLVEELSVEKDRLNSEYSELTREQEEILSKELAGYSFATGDTTGWLSGYATAYGGSSDSMTPSVARTATGAICDDSSFGVAIPMSMPNYRSYFGKKVEISYNGRSVIATVNDCGGMGGGATKLDLQPGVFKALGFSTCNDWGRRIVVYRFLD